jgi:hypothetical protein
MNKVIPPLSFFIALLTFVQISTAQWKIPTDAPLLTKWAKDVSPTNALPEYPRPQMVRDEWMNLNGLWQYREAKENEDPPFGEVLAGTILVPYPIESALSGVMKTAERLWYRRTAMIPKEWTGRKVVLHFGAVDWETKVFVNGLAVGHHRGGYDPFSFDITTALKPDGEQEIVVGVYDPSDGGDQPRGKQVLKPSGIWYTPSTGIWQTVWLEPVASEHISALVFVPDVDARSITVTALSAGESIGCTVRVEVHDGTEQVAESEGRVGAEIVIPVKSPRLWSPDSPFLYDVNIRLLRGGNQVDAVKSYFGMRKIEIARDAKGVKRIFLNGKFEMLVGPLDQGFWPDGIYTAPTDGALRSDIEMTKKLGFNMARKHVKVEPDRWYYWADKLGLMVWQDMPSGNNKTDDSKMQFETELANLVVTHYNHPSIVMWVVFNEGWGQYDAERLAAWVKQLDPTRLVNSASGWTDKKAGDVLDIHHYPQPRSPQPDSTRAIVLGEFGGLGLGIDGHTWKQEHWGYQGMTDVEQLTSRYEKFMKRVYEFKDAPGLSAAIYTQTTDVEVECNGLMTYDRKIVKPILERVAAVNRGDFSKVPPPPIVKTIIPTSEEQGREWRYTFDKPLENWIRSEFSDSGWKNGLGGFGTKGTPGAIVRTEWKSNDIWMRTEVVVAAESYTSLYFRLHHDDDAEVYINGVLAGTYGGYTSEYEEVPLTAEGRNAIKPGKNTIAVHCKQTKGGQYIDVGIVDLLPPGPRQ